MAMLSCGKQGLKRAKTGSARVAFPVAKGEREGGLWQGGVLAQPSQQPSLLLLGCEGPARANSFVCPGEPPNHLRGNERACAVRGTRT